MIKNKWMVFKAVIIIVSIVSICSCGNFLKDFVFVSSTMFDLKPTTSYECRQPDSDMFRLWEIAGAAHADVYTVLGLFDTGGNVYYAKILKSSSPIPGIVKCSTYINGNPTHHFVINAAFHAMSQWILTGIAPVSVDRIEVDTETLEIVKDEYGNALGGIRSPYIDVSTATFTAVLVEEVDDLLCATFGSMTPFSDEELLSIYSSPEAYMNKVQAATDQAVSRGHLRPKDAELVMRAATTFSHKLN